VVVIGFSSDSDMPQICIPKPKEPEAERKISIYRVAARWKIPAFYARHKLLMHGVPFIKVEQPAIEGVMLRDLLELERRIAVDGDK
jgi:hypothetical protein